MNPDDFPLWFTCEWCYRNKHADDIYVSGKDLLCSSCVEDKRLTHEYLERLDRLYVAPF